MKNEKILNLKILINIIILLSIVLLLKKNMLMAYFLELDNIIFNNVKVETCKAILQIYTVQGGLKYIINQYPIEIFIIYNDFLQKNFSLLDYLLNDQLRSVIITERPQIFNIWAPAYLDKKSDFLRGETFSGNIVFNKKKISFTFYYSIQDADGYNLEKKDKRWPFLFDLIQQHKKNNLFSLNIQHNIENFTNSSKIEIILKQKSLKIKKGYITERNVFKEDLIKIYNEIYKSKPSIFMMFEKKTKFQLLVMDYSSNYYIDLFENEKNIDNLIKNKGKFYNEEWIKVVWNWWYKYMYYIYKKK